MFRGLSLFLSFHLPFCALQTCWRICNSAADESSCPQSVVQVLQRGSSPSSSRSERIWVKAQETSACKAIHKTFLQISEANEEAKGYRDRDVVLSRALTQPQHPSSRSCPNGREGPLSTQRLDGSMSQDFHWDCLVISREQKTKKPWFSTLEGKGMSPDRTQTNQTRTVPVPVTAVSPFLSLRIHYLNLKMPPWNSAEIFLLSIIHLQ